MLQEASASKDDSDQSTCLETTTECHPNQGLPFEENNDENDPGVKDGHKLDKHYEEDKRNLQLLAMNGGEVDGDVTIDRGTRRKKRKEWKRVELKRKVLNGEEHNSSSGTKIPKKEPKPLIKHPDTCRTKCTDHFRETDRADICQKYWNIRNYQRQRDWLCSVLEKENVRTHSVVAI